MIKKKANNNEFLMKKILVPTSSLFPYSMPRECEKLASAYDVTIEFMF